MDSIAGNFFEKIRNTNVPSYSVIICTSKCGNVCACTTNEKRINERVFRLQQLNFYFQTEIYFIVQLNA